MAKRKRTGNRSFPKRATLWLPFDISIAMTVAGTVVESGDMLGNYFAQTGEEVPVGATLGPVRGSYLLFPTTPGSVDRICSVEAVMQLNREGGRAILPVGGVDIVDAMWYGSIFWASQAWEVASGNFQGGGTRGDFSTKAMRKVTGNGQTLTVSANDNTSVDFTMRMIGNTLLRLP